MWSRGTSVASRTVRGAHSGGVFSVCALREGGLLSAGGKDGRIVLFDDELNATGTEAVVSYTHGITTSHYNVYYFELGIPVP